MIWNAYYLSVWIVLGLGIGLAGGRKKDKLPTGLMSWAASGCLLYFGFGMGVSFPGAWAAACGGWIKTGISQGGWIGGLSLTTAAFLATATGAAFYWAGKDIAKDKKPDEPAFVVCVCSFLAIQCVLATVAGPGVHDDLFGAIGSQLAGGR